MLWITDPPEIVRIVTNVRGQGQKVGLVPTMGNLHEGHLSLMRTARAETDFVVVTLFVNPLQFVQGEDFERYPRTPDQDRTLCEQGGCDAIFAPSTEVMYPPGASTVVQVRRLEEPLCGKSRPGHFVGVATVVAKLFHLVPADIAYFGLKDYQQTRVIAQMVRDLDFPVELRFCPTVREPDGLAMSSRNAYLSTDERRQASVLFQALEHAANQVKQGQRDAGVIRQSMLELINSQPLAVVDYVALVDPQSLLPITMIQGPVLAALAVRFGKARLIDNRLIEP